MEAVPDDLASQLYAAIAAEAAEEPSPALEAAHGEITELQSVAVDDVIEIDDDDTEAVQSTTYNLSDVLDVIQNHNFDEFEDDDDKVINTTMYGNRNPDVGQQHQMGGATGAPPGPSQPGHRMGSTHRQRPRAYTEITEQPAPKALRFRYECEGRSAGSIPGIRSTSENKTFPSIRVCGHRGDYFCVVSCVTKDAPYKPHPHNLVGRDCKDGVCTVKMTEENMSITFNNLGIQCIRKKDIEEALKKREVIRVDPFKTGFSHRNQPSSIDLNAIRLCFQVFVQGQTGLSALQPAISEPIFDKKAMSELVITKLSHCSAPVSGGKEVILLCEKVAKEDIAVRFYEEQDGQVVWEANGDFQHNNVHKQVAIAFKIPPYRLLKIDHMTRVFLQLKRPSDGATSDPVTFDYLPVETEQMPKRKKIEDRKSLFQFVHDRAEQQQQQQQQHQMDYRQTAQQSNVPGGFLNIKVDPIKQEPRDHSPGNYDLFGGYRVTDGQPPPQPPSPLLNLQQQPGSPYNSPMHHQQQQHQQQQQQHHLYVNNLFGNPIPETLPQTTGATPGNLFQNTFQPPPQQQHQPQQGLMNAPVSPANIQQLPASIQQQQQPQTANPFMQYNQNTQSNQTTGGQQVTQQQQQQQQQWNMQPGIRPMNDLSSSTATTTQNMNPFQQQLPQNILGGGQQQQQQQAQQSESVPMNILPDGLLDSTDFSQLNDLLPNSAMPSLSRLEQDQENMTDSLTKLILKNLGESSVP